MIERLKIHGFQTHGQQKYNKRGSAPAPAHALRLFDKLMTQAGVAGYPCKRQHGADSSKNK